MVKGKGLVELTGEEERVREEVRRMPDEELKREYQKVNLGSQVFIESLRGNIIGSANNPTHYRAYSNALDTYRFVKKCLQEGKTKLKVRENARNSSYVNAGELLLDAVRRIAILEEYTKRS